MASALIAGAAGGIFLDLDVRVWLAALAAGWTTGGVALVRGRPWLLVAGVLVACAGAGGALGDREAERALRPPILQQIADVDAPVLIGGPVQPERGFVLHTPGGAWESSFRISDQISVTTSRDILLAIASGNGPRHAVVALAPCTSRNSSESAPLITDTRQVRPPSVVRPQLPP